MHHRGHQRADTPQVKGNCLADQVAKQAAGQDNTATKLTVMPAVSSLLTTKRPQSMMRIKPPGYELSKILAQYLVIPCLIALCADVSH